MDKNTTPARPMIGHIRPGENGTYIIQTLNDHLRGCAAWAEQFGQSFGAPNWAYALAVLHDQGKRAPDFQRYIRRRSGYEPGPYQPADHKYRSAILCPRVIGNADYAHILQYCIAGHHGGLPDTDELKTGMKQQEPIPDSMALPVIKDRPLETPANGLLTPGNLHHWIRMLYSTLVDADYLDTEQFMTPEKAGQRTQEYDTIATLNARVEAHLQTLHDKPGPINRLRRQILDEAVDRAADAPGIYSLTVPTGGGKTLTSMRWALAHAQACGKERIIVVIPYTSIIIQTAQVYRDILGTNNVIEHHSNLQSSPEGDTSASGNTAGGDQCRPGELAAENWDAPVIVTTNVRFFESLYSHKPSACRRLHNLSNSVIIFDEVQMFSPEHLRPILHSLEALNTLFRSTLLLMTATQPVLTGAIGSRRGAFEGLTGVTEIISRPDRLQEQFRRVQVTTDLTPRTSEEIARQMNAHKRVLCIVNSRTKAREIYDHLHDDVPPLHLSRRMCPAHLLDTLGQIKAGGHMRVVATQLVEAGVDIDFPVVYRELAGLDSLAQAAGRCNREGRQQHPGQVHLFVHGQNVPPGLMRKAADAARSMFPPGQGNADHLLTPGSFAAYFEQYYRSLNGIFDKTDACEQSRQLNFRTVGERFRLIDDEGVDIIVAYGKGAEKIAGLDHLAEPPGKHHYRALQPYTVAVHPNEFQTLLKAGAVRPVAGLWVQNSDSLYNDRTGITIENPFEDELLIS